MPAKKTLYQVLQVNRQASAEVIRAAYEARVAALGDSAAPELAAQRTVLRDALELLSDPVRRAHYDEKLREETLRALSSGSDGDESRPRPANARRAEAEPVTAAGASPMGWMIGLALLGAVAVAGTWVYYDHLDKREAKRLAAERQAAEQREREALVEDRRQVIGTAQEHLSASRASAEERRKEAERRYERQRWERDQYRAAQEVRGAEQRAQYEQRRAEAEQRRIEQENLRQQQIQLERDRRFLRELERERPMRF